MKSFFIAAFAMLALFSSCSTVYRSGQTPDDVYYSSSPAKSGGYVAASNGREDGRRYEETGDGYDDYAGADDRWLMMRVRNRSRWSVFDDYNYYNPYNDFGYGGMGGFGYGYSPGMSFGFNSGFYNPYAGFGLGMGYGGFGYNNYFNNYYNWNSFYNPYYSNVIVLNPKTNPAGYTTIRNFNMGGYTNRNYNTTNGRTPLRPNYNGYSTPNNRINSNNNRRYGGGSTRYYSNGSTLDNGSSGRSYSNDRPVRTYSPSNNSSYSPRSSGVSGSSSGSSNSGGGGGASSGSRPSRR